MKNLFLYITLVALALSSCSGERSQENKGADQELSKTVINFLKWYKDNNARINSIQLINYPGEDDTTAYYTVNYDSAKKYLRELSEGGYLSDTYLNVLNEHIRSSEKKMAEEEQNDGPPVGLDYDYVMNSQDFESDLDSIDANVVVIQAMRFKKDRGYVLVDFKYGPQSGYYLSRSGNKWLIDKIKN